MSYMIVTGFLVACAFCAIVILHPKIHDNLGQRVALSLLALDLVGWASHLIRGRENYTNLLWLLVLSLALMILSSIPQYLRSIQHSHHTGVHS